MGTEADYLIDQNFDREHGEYGDNIIQGDAPPAISYHRIIGEDVDPVPAVTYASFNCPRGMFKCGDNVLCGDCKGFTETCENCTRLKTLPADVWRLSVGFTTTVNKLAELEARIKQEGIL